MPVENIKSTLVTNLEAVPSVVTEHSNGASLRNKQDSFDVGVTTGSNGSTYMLLPTPSNTHVQDLAFISDGTVDLPNANIGLYHESGKADLIDADCFVSALDIDPAGAPAKAVDVDAYATDTTKRLWEYVDGLTEDCGGLFYVLVTLGANAAAVGNVKGRMTFVAN